MFDSGNNVITKVLNPLKVTKSSLIEFNIGELKDTGLYRFKKIIELTFGEKSYARYIIYSVSEDAEYVLEVFPGSGGHNETYLYGLVDTIPFSEDFLDVAGQRFLTTPEGNEYLRCIMPDEEGRIDGVSGVGKVYNIEIDEIERDIGIKLWDYKRDVNGDTEYLNVEMSQENGMFRIFIGEMIEDIFYKFYQTSKQD